MLVMSLRNAFVKRYNPASHCDFLRAIASMKMCGVLKVVYTGNGRRSQWCHGPTIFGPIWRRMSQCSEWERGTECPTALRGRSQFIIESASNGGEGCSS